MHYSHERSFLCMKNYEIDIGKLFVNNFVCFDLIAKEISLIYDV